jgi:two-component system, chemotaxis family, protein-glutamate methylesterase/glutaminase
MGTARGAPFASATRARVAPTSGDREIVVVGAPAASTQLASMFLVGLPPAFALPLVVILGGAHGDDRERLINLQAHCALPVRLVDDKDPILPARIHLAPADYHLLIERDHFALSTAAPVRGARPSIDVLFQSVADAFGPRAVCVLLGRDEDVAGDGRAGAAKVRARGGLVIVEDPATAAVGGRAFAEETLLSTATVLHLSEIAPFVSTLGEWEVT